MRGRTAHALVFGLSVVATLLMQTACDGNDAEGVNGPGVWHDVEHRLVMNTPGEADGILQAWFDGRRVLDEPAFLFRLADGNYGIDALYFSTFFGGGDDTWAPAASQVTDFDDFVVSTGPIGPRAGL
jgi:hypothetical protein